MPDSRPSEVLDPVTGDCAWCDDKKLVPLFPVLDYTVDPIHDELVCEECRDRYDAIHMLCSIHAA